MGSAARHADWIKNEATASTRATAKALKDLDNTVCFILSFFTFHQILLQGLPHFVLQTESPSKFFFVMFSIRSTRISVNSLLTSCPSCNICYYVTCDSFNINFTSGSGVITSNSWLSIDIALSQFLAANPSLVLSGLQQLLWVDNGTVGGGVQGGDFYIDNVYFYRWPPETNGVHASIVSGTLVSWTASSANSYQPQKSADNSNWTDFGPVLSGNAITSRFDPVKSPFYHVLELAPGNVTPNPGFETVGVNAIGAANWNIAVQPNTGASMWVTNQYGVLSAHGGTNFLFIESNTSATGPVAAPNTDVRSDLFPVTAAISYQLSFYAANPVKTGGANPQYHVFFYDAGNALVGGPIFTSFAAVGSAWTLVTNTVTPPRRRACLRQRHD